MLAPQMLAPPLEKTASGRHSTREHCIDCYYDDLRRGSNTTSQKYCDISKLSFPRLRSASAGDMRMQPLTLTFLDSTVEAQYREHRKNTYSKSCWPNLLGVFIFGLATILSGIRWEKDMAYQKRAILTSIATALFLIYTILWIARKSFETKIQTICTILLAISGSLWSAAAG
jgi:hypothetical protein